MDIQETIDSVRKVLEGVIAPGVESLRSRLDSLEKEVRESGQGVYRLDGRVDHLAARVDSLAERMNDGFARLDARVDALGTGHNARVDHLAERMEDGFSRLDARLDTLTAAILAARRPTATDPVLTRVKKLEREVEALRKKA
ncbi:MAG: hypothetical protein U7M05_07240 [Candidatus Igneacidithiobacillus chanchocoensis]